MVNVDVPIYVGISSDIDRRIIAHKYTGKEFTRHVIIEEFQNKQRALDAERCIIKYLSLFGMESNVNAKYIPIQEKEVYRNLYPSKKTW